MPEKPAHKRLTIRSTGIASSPRQIRYGGEVVAHVHAIRDRDEWYWCTQPTSGSVLNYSTHTDPFRSIEGAERHAMAWLRDHFAKIERIAR